MPAPPVEMHTSHCFMISPEISMVGSATHCSRSAGAPSFTMASCISSQARVEHFLDRG